MLGQILFNNAYSFIPLACAECYNSLPFSGASSIPLCYVFFPATLLHAVLALIRRCDDLPATITHVPVAAVLVLNTPDDGRLRPKHVE